MNDMAALDVILKHAIGQEPENLPPYIAKLKTDTLYASGTTLPILGQMRFYAHPSGLLVPVSVRDPTPLDYATVYTVMNNYLDLGRLAEEAAADLARRLPRLEMLTLLAALNHVTHEPDEEKRLQNYYVKHLAPRVRQRLESSLGQDHDGPKVRFLSRQAILAAMRLVLTAEVRDSYEAVPVDPVCLAILLTHGVSSTFERVNDGDEMLGTFPGALALDLTQNMMFYQPLDVMSLIDRQVRLWRTYGSRIQKTKPRLPPSELIRDATGIELEDIMALGFALYAHAASRSQEDHLWANADFNSDMDSVTKARFLNIVSSTITEIGPRLQGVVDPWDFLEFHTHPVIFNDHKLLVLDEELVIDRVLNGLYWIVHEHERHIQRDSGWKLWTQVYGEIVELFVEDHLRSLAPTVVGSDTTTLYTEEHFGAVYSGKSCDAVLHFGRDICLVEIVSGQVTQGTRFKGDLQRFRDDTEKLVMKKARQLNDSAESVLSDESALTGHPATLGLRVVPVVVVGGGYPVNPFTVEYVRGLIASEGLLAQARVLPLSVISLDELEMIEGLAERGHALPDLLRGWHDSSLNRMPLGNYLIHRFETVYPEGFRPQHVKNNVDTTFQEIMSRLKLRS